jgi:hypothetical protein
MLARATTSREKLCSAVMYARRVSAGNPTVSQVTPYADPTDLVTRCQAGDAAAFDALYLHNEERVYGSEKHKPV